MSHVSSLRIVIQSMMNHGLVNAISCHLITYSRTGLCVDRESWWRHHDERYSKLSSLGMELFVILDEGIVFLSRRLNLFESLLASFGGESFYEFYRTGQP